MRVTVNTTGPSISPDGRYEVRYFRVFNLRSLLPVSPGSGSDNAEGFVNLCDRRTGKVLHSVFYDNFKGREAQWVEHAVVFLGEDGLIWELPPDSPAPAK